MDIKILKLELGVLFSLRKGDLRVQEEMFEESKTAGRTRLSSEFGLIQPLIKNKEGSRRFSNRIVPIWNKLDNDTRNVNQSRSAFASKINKVEFLKWNKGSFSAAAWNVSVLNRRLREQEYCHNIRFFM